MPSRLHRRGFFVRFSTDPWTMSSEKLALSWTFAFVIAALD